MRKELFVAIIGGFVLGLIIMVGGWVANQAVNKTKINPVPTSGQITRNPTPTPNQFFLTILKPEEQSFINSDKTIISGNTLPNLPIVILWETGENILESDDQGNFDLEIPLISGINEIKITAFANNYQEVSKNLKVYYSKEDI